jgi:hypothetical protein
MPRPQVYGHRRRRVQAQIWPHRHAWEHFLRPVALCGPTARPDACPGLGNRWMRAVIPAGGRSRLPAPPPRQEVLLLPSGEVQTRDLARRRVPAGARLARTVHDGCRSEVAGRAARYLRLDSSRAHRGQRSARRSGIVGADQASADGAAAGLRRQLHGACNRRLSTTFSCSHGMRYTE